MTIPKRGGSRQLPHSPHPISTTAGTSLLTKMLLYSTTTRRIQIANYSILLQSEQSLFHALQTPCYDINSLREQIEEEQEGRASSYVLNLKPRPKWPSGDPCTKATLFNEWKNLNRQSKLFFYDAFLRQWLVIESNFVFLERSLLFVLKKQKSKPKILLSLPLT